MTAGPEDSLWVCEHFKVVRVTTGGQATDLPLPSAPTWMAISIAAGPDGALWLTLGVNPFIANNHVPPEIARLTPDGGFTQYPMAGGTSRLVAGPDGNMWFTGGSTSPAIGRITPQGAITEFPLTGPWPSSAPAFAHDGTLWYDESDATGIGHFDPGSGSVTQVPLEQGSVFLDEEGGPAVDAAGNVWVGISQYAEGLYRITPSGSVSHVLPPGVSLPSVLGTTVDGQVIFEVAQCVCGNGPNLPLALGTVASSATITSLLQVVGPQSPDGMSSTYVAAVCLGPDGHIWFVTDTQPYNLSQPSQTTGWIFRIN